MNIQTQPTLVASSRKANLMWPSISGDGSTIAYAKSEEDDGLFRYRDGETVKLSEGSSAWQDISTDGDAISFMRTFGYESRQVHRWTPERTKVLADEPGYGRPTHISPDGPTVVWTSDQSLQRGHRSDVLTWHDGQIKEVSDAPKAYEGRLPGESGLTVWVEYPERYSPREFVFKKNSEESTRVVNILGHQPEGWDVSADGNQIVFSEWDVEEKGWDLFLHNALENTTIGIATDNTDALHPDISADGSAIAYTSRTGDDQGSIKVFRDGKTFEVESPSDGYNLAPSISDDGKHLAWTAIEGRARSIYKTALVDPSGALEKDFSRRMGGSISSGVPCPVARHSNKGPPSVST